MSGLREPSRTALTAAAARAAHLMVDGAPTIFADPLAETLLGDRADELINYHRAHGAHPVLAGARAQATCRSRYTEERLAAATRSPAPSRRCAGSPPAPNWSWTTWCRSTCATPTPGSTSTWWRR
jgi:hypothetical protein